MKKLALLLTTFCFSIHSYSQVTGVAYVIEKDDVSGDFDCKLIITEGAATTFQDLEQLISTFTIVVPNGTNISYVESYNPLTDNQTFMGTIPMEWQLSNSAIAPNEQPGSDYYSYTPQISPSVNYNVLNDGDVVSLFRFSAEATCNLDIRPIDNDIDATILSGTDYSNGFTIGNTNQIYSGNQLPSSFDADFAIAESEATVCFGECVTITPEVVCAPLGLTYSWNTGETTESITVCPTQYEIYDVTVIGPAGLSESTTVSVLVDEDIIYFDEVDFFCVGQSYFANSEFGNNNWASSDESIASFDNNELLIYAEGTVTISSTSPGGCVTELEITTSPLPIINFEGSSEICIGETTQLSPYSGVFWDTDNPSVATIDENGNIIGTGAGSTFPTCTDLITGCSITSDIPITVLPAPIIQNNGSDELCVGETTLIASANDGTWESTNSQITTIDNSGLVTAISSGEAYFAFTETENGCTSTYGPIINTSLPEITSGEPQICIGETTNLLPSTGGTWASSNSAVASITNDGIVTGVSKGSANFSFTDTMTGCSSELSSATIVNVCEVAPARACNEIEDIICDIDLLNNFVGLMYSDDSGGNQPLPLCSDGGGPHNISWVAFVAPEGTYTVVITASNCAGSTTGQEGVQIGIYTDCTFSESVYCNPNCSLEPVSIESAYLVSGETYYFFIDGCSSSVCEYEINFTGNYISQCESQCDDSTINTDWTYVPAGEFDQDYNIITYSTGSNLDIGDDRDHLVFYDYNTGNVYLKENNSNGFLDNEVLLFNNEDHYANGIYKIYLEDIDNDGLTDIILAESNIVTMTGEIGDQISVYQNFSDYSFGRQINERVCEMQGPDQLEIVDFDNDGMKDIFFVCTDRLYDILWINSWEETEKTDFNAQTFCHFYTGDFNQDGNIDIAFNNNEFLTLLNNGDRTFTNSNMIAYESGCQGLSYFVEESNTILGPYFASIILDPSSLETEFCSDHYFGDNENKIFRANIFSPDEESVIVPQVEGFHTVDPNQECDFSIDGVEIPSVAARENTKIDITLNGCTDFLVIEGNQIFAWINPKQSTKILGTAFIDENENGIYDSNELPLRNVLVSIAPGDFSILTDDDGNYAFSVPPGTYTITANVNEGEWIETELTINNIQIFEPCNEGYNFGFAPNTGPEEMATLSMVNTIARCDFETRFTITVENTGAEPLEGALVFTFDDQTTFFSSDIASYQVIGNTVTADVSSLTPFSPQTYKITVKMPSGSSNLPILDFDAKLYDKFGQVIEEYGYSDQLRCSYDPNDKREYPDREGEDNLTLMDEDIEYTIRFQNNGNDTAFLVKIVDPLDPSIDPSTIRVMNSSHPVETCIEGTDLIFLFEDILLVDSTTNYPGSQGFVTFRCNAKEGLAEFTPAHNQADIIFDTNVPIVTNQTINTLVSVLCTDEETILQVAICDGETYNGYSVSGTYTESFELPFGCDSTVITVLDVQGITVAQNTVDICSGESIFFNGTSYNIAESTQLTDSLYSDIGCLSDILTLQVNVTEISYTEEDISLCEGDEITINGNNYTFTESSEIIDSSINAAGCVTDISTYLISVLPTVYEQLDTTICEGFDYEGLTVAGTYTIDSFDLATGCQLVYTINLNVLPASDPACTVGTDDFDENLIKLYPNPATESIFIETDKTWESIKIVDTQGKIVKSIIDTRNGKLEINISQYLSGVYMVVFQDGDRNLTKRFVVR